MPDPSVVIPYLRDFPRAMRHMHVFSPSTSPTWVWPGLPWTPSLEPLNAQQKV